MKSLSLRVALLLSCFGLGSLGCAASPGREQPLKAPSPAESPRVNEAPELTVDEQRLIQPLRDRVAHLSQKIGERNEENHWELAEAADYLAAELEGMGMPVERQGYETRNVAAQNLAVTVPGGERGDQVFVVGVHYDSPAGDRGENAGASATAALLSLVELMKDARLKRTLRLVFFSMGESPHGDGDARGARHYARLLTEKPTTPVDSPLAPAGASGGQMEPVGVLFLDRLGSFSPQEQRAATFEMELEVSPQGDVVRDLFMEDLDGDLWAVTERAQLANDADSDLLAFVGSGIPGASLKGTGTDETPVQYEEMARVVMQLRRAIGRICGEKPTNDGMLTPLTGQIR